MTCCHGKASLRLSDADLKAVKEDNERHVTIDNWELMLVHDLEQVMKNNAKDTTRAPDQGHGWKRHGRTQCLPKLVPRRSDFTMGQASKVRPSNKDMSALLQRLGFKRTGFAWA